MVFISSDVSRHLGNSRIVICSEGHDAPSLLPSGWLTNLCHPGQSRDTGTELNLIFVVCFSMNRINWIICQNLKTFLFERIEKSLDLHMNTHTHTHTHTYMHTHTHTHMRTRTCTKHAECECNQATLTWLRVLSTPLWVVSLSAKGRTCWHWPAPQCRGTPAKHQQPGLFCLACCSHIHHAHRGRILNLRYHARASNISTYVAPNCLTNQFVRSAIEKNFAQHTFHFCSISRQFFESKTSVAHWRKHFQSFGAISCCITPYRKRHFI